MKRNAMLVAVALAFASGAALAQSAPPAGADRSPRMHLDADGDNRISREEAANHPRLAAEFDRIDTDRDGFLSRNEMRAAHGARGKGRSKLDVNGDGYISRDEASSAPRLAQQFDQLDTDKDGLLSQAEMRAGWEARRGERGFGPHHGQGPNHAQGPHHARGAHLDVNGDGYISREEAQGSPGLTQRFDAIDTNKDGLLSRDELKAWRQNQRLAPRS
jgi:Ca2+-binding EF-hand superfamily protein